jgi:hypothetical protein
MKRCVPFFVHEGSYPQQAVGICMGIYNKATRKTDMAPSLDHDSDHEVE